MVITRPRIVSNVPTGNKKDIALIYPHINVMALTHSVGMLITGNKFIKKFITTVITVRKNPVIISMGFRKMPRTVVLVPNKSKPHASSYKRLECDP